VRSKEVRPLRVSKEKAVENYHIIHEPFYLPIGDEVQVFETAYQLKLPVMLGRRGSWSTWHGSSLAPW
jgi:hypothetical protein